MQNINKKILKRIIYILSLIILLLISYFYDYLDHAINGKFSNEIIPNNEYVSSFSPNDENIYLIGLFKVNRIVDGDTIHVLSSENKEEIVRFLAVNTSEMKAASEREKCMAELQKEFTSENIFDKNVELWGDATQSKRDKYDRLLAYVRVADATSTNIFFNDTLVQSGNAIVFRSSPPASLYKKYLNYQASAQKQNLGLWNKDLCK